MNYPEFLVSRIFERNDFGSWPALREALTKASSLNPNTNWRGRKILFNAIATKAPMRDNGYCLKYEEVAHFIESESAAFAGNQPNQELSFDLKDASDHYGGTIQATLDVSNKMMAAFQFEGYSDCTSLDSKGSPLCLELYEDDLRLLVYADINSEEPTQVISLESARNENRNTTE